MNLFLYSFNNYYNRLVKTFDDIDDYGAPKYVQTKCNFKVNDGLNAEVVLNIQNPDVDYLVVTDDLDTAIRSRWFIMEATKTRESQYQLILKRDVVADYKDKILDAPAFIEKATLSKNNPLIFNNENMTFNQIKTEEILLKDKFAHPWVVGYINRTMEAKTISTPTKSYVVDYTLNSLEEYDYYNYTEQEFRTANANKITLGFNCYHDGFLGITDRTTYTIGFDRTGSLADPPNRIYQAFGLSASSGDKEGWRIPAFGSAAAVRSEIEDKAPDISWSSIDYTPYIPIDYYDLSNEEGKIIQSGSDYYRIRIRSNGVKKLTSEIDKTSALGLKFTQLRDMLTTLETTSEPPLYLCFTEVESKNIYFERINIDSVEVVIPGESERVHCSDAPYDIFAIPYADYKLTYYDSDLDRYTTIASDKDTSMRICQNISNSLGSDLYDIQLLPYCPLAPEVIYENGWLDLHYYTDETGWWSKLINTRTTSVCGGLFWVPNSNFEQKIPNVEIPGPKDAIECKIMSETRKYRLCSPNYASVFEINAAKNNGLMNFVASCSYKPVTPYIQVAPEFNRLYGTNFKDARGLICGGDFSLPRTTSAWIEYNLNNKNYQLAFDRQIDNLEFNNSLQRFEQTAKAIVGTISGGATGAAIGSVAGGIGAGVGAGIGALTSAAGGIIDYDILIKKQQEVMDYTKDMYGYQLGNIAAQPRTLTKVSAFNINNKIFPFLEVYTCTEEEEQAFINKLKWNGMTVMVIGSIGSYIQESESSYIKCKLIRVEGIEEDFHVLLALNEELNKGVFI